LLKATEIASNRRFSILGWYVASGGTVVAKEEDRTRRVDKGKSGQALKTAVSGGFGGGILSQDLKRTLVLLGERIRVRDAVDEQQ
jgi:hypothetical protein